MYLYNIFWDSEILDFNQYYKSGEVWSIIYADREFLMEKTDGCKNNPEKSSTTKPGENIWSSFFNYTIYN